MPAVGRRRWRGGSSGMRDCAGHRRAGTRLTARPCSSPGCASQRAPTAPPERPDRGPTALLPRGDSHYGLVHGVAAREEAAAVGGARTMRRSSPRVQDVFGWRAGRFMAVRAAATRSSAAWRALIAPRAVLVATPRGPSIRWVPQGLPILGLRDALTLPSASPPRRWRPGDAADPGAVMPRVATTAAHAGVLRFAWRA